MSDAVYAARAADEQIEEFDTDDEESGGEANPITDTVGTKPVVENAHQNPAFSNKPLKPIIGRQSATTFQSNKIQHKPKILEKKITINIKTPLIIETSKDQPGSPKSSDSKVEVAVETKDHESEKEIQNTDKENTYAAAPDYAKHLSYEGALCVYTEPETGCQMIWNADKNAWISRSKETSLQTNQTANNSTKSADSKDDLSRSSESQDQGKFTAVDHEAVDEETNRPESAVPGGIYGFEGDTHTYTDPNDGSVYMWDREKNAWFPKVDDEFLARYQMNYGFTDPSADQTDATKLPVKIESKVDKEQKKAEAKRKAQEPSTWFEVDEAHNTAVYITGLPLDITMEELTSIVTKYGLLARDDKGKDKIKLYKDKDGQPKGDALVTYIKVESVNLALHLLDGSQIRGNTLSVQRAKFQMKGTYDPALKPKRKKKDKERAKKIHEKLFDWRPERMRGEPQKCERVVIIKNLFNPTDFDKEVTLLLEYQQDLRAECSKCGEVKKVVLYDRHPEGVAQVTFKEPAEAQACIQLLNGRWFAQKQISAEIWDGKTKYKIVETEAEIEERIAKWDKFLDDEDDKKEAAKKKAAEDAAEREQKTVQL
ncbi:HIV Tat-specific factor 1 homolog [Athalia rosae]|uniref:HIV Tat-specific factor 1 homolog n=1 Tax=Athalia rosae TaxID=37344 RepID=UPI00203483BA|nr:HIV Tat-specific factor 1 homolog [Athalia rosae]XP_012258684.2 HIV Tat-specific factor 1 homolog [Athalia rosae]XP_012258686.2 HIV Tat-specific factor 1 homolog [Athalia rosae]XP_012258688.2 HIV Tat-specific factor 1 homolog [Athalia rosae]XP_048510622.1 HIV Tat-specific factor 1 homolog [Athalia rosae]XP_048510623.1 HIV Tat-specific factor 1 homolog [Athalia rosae]